MAHHHCLAWGCSDSACGAVGGVADPQPAGKRFSFCVNGVSPWFRVGMGLTAPGALLGGVADPKHAGKLFFIKVNGVSPWSALSEGSTMVGQPLEKVLGANLRA
jgi:hypothetical protein